MVQWKRTTVHVPSLDGEGRWALVGSASSSGSGEAGTPRRMLRQGGDAMDTFQFVMSMLAFGTFLLTLLKFIFDYVDKKRK